MNIDNFYNSVKELDINLTKDKMNKLEDYYNLLIEENEKINLTTITNKEDVYLKHFYDSLTLIKACNLNKEITLCDIGTGAGFPGVVLSICFPNLKVTVVESIKKKINFLDKRAKSCACFIKGTSSYGLRKAQPDGGS